MANKINISKHFLLIVAMLFVAITTFAYEPMDNQQHLNAAAPNEHSEKEHVESTTFDAGKMILEHVADSHDWHMWGEGDHAVSIPLPIIIYSDKGFDVFSSSRFHHGHASFQSKYNYRLHEGNVVVFDDLTGNIDEEATAKLTDFSLTKNVASMLVTMLLMLWVFITVAKAYKNNQGKAPRGLQSFVEPLIIFVRDDVAKPSIGDKRYEKFMPFLLTVFFFIMFSNYLGLIPVFPGGVNLTGSISIAMVLAGFTLLITFVVANKHYWRHVFAMPGWFAGHAEHPARMSWRHAP